MFKSIRQLLKPPVFEGDEEKNRVAALTNTILVALVVLITMAALVVVVALRNYVMMGMIYVSMMLPVGISIGLLRRGHVRAAAVIVIAALWLILVGSGAFIGGVTNAGYTTVVIVIIMAALLLGGRGGLMLAGLSAVAVIGVYIAGELDLLPPPLRPDDSLSYFINHLLNYAISGSLLYLAMTSLAATLRRARQLAAESERQQAELRELVQVRTQDLTRNANYLAATTSLARESAAAMGDPEEFLERVVKRLSEQFNFYHTGIFLLDQAREWAELRAASSLGGQQLIANGHRLRVGAEGMVGDVAYRGTYRLAADVSQDGVYMAVPELPDTRAELALPLRVHNEIVGVLDIQSAEPGVFSPQDVLTLQSLADQIAVALSNSQLLVQVQAAAEFERRAYSEATGQAWQTLLKAGQSLGFYSNVQATMPISDLWRPEMRTALQTGSTVKATEDVKSLAVPVKVRGEVIGVIDFAKADTDSAWTGEEVALVESLTEQLGVALDSARLYQDTQRRAVQERLVGEVTSRMRESLDMETVLKTAAQEMRQVLGVSELHIRLTSPDKEAAL
ncbi:MAG TPA: GAF domain-containing protein [Anaerolineae bacterium]|nr:GAF domain-containing protein [Anaerolineae bacterium]